MNRHAPVVPDLQFIVGGGWTLSFDFRVVGGPDDGRRVSLVPLRSDISNDAQTGDGGRWSQENRPGFASPDPWGRDGETPLAEATLHACYAKLVEMSTDYPPRSATQHMRLGVCQRGADPNFAPERLPLPKLRDLTHLIHTTVHLDKPAHGAGFELVEIGAESATIRDTNEHDRRSVTNDAEAVVTALHRHGLGTRRLFYYDTHGDRDELVHNGAGRFLRFEPGNRGES